MISLSITRDWEATDHEPSRASTLIVVSLEYGQSLSPKVTMEETFRRELDRHPYIHRHLFIDADIVGVIRAYDWTTMDILAFHMKTGDCVLVPCGTQYVRNKNSYSFIARP